MENALLLLREDPRDVSDEVIGRITNFKEALRLCKSISGLNDQQICQELDIDPGQWSRIWSNNAHFPVEKITCFMNLCENVVPVRWLAMQYGFELRPMKSALEKEIERLTEALKKSELEMGVIKDFLRDIKRK
ncbi:MAG: hypothetical protein JW943_07465 [Deltaproteobacteria bacterium]|nr:hypothetical protein [Deltaproteobacteria bacterium]